MKIKPLHCYVQKVLPLVYDDSISYYEVLAKTTSKLNEVIHSINDLTENIEGMIDDKIQAALEDFKRELIAELQQQIDDINARIDGANERITALTGRVNDDEVLIVALRSDLDNLAATLTNALQNITRRLDQIETDYKKADADIYVFFLAKIAQIEEEIQHIVLADVTVIDPVTGTREDIQTALNDLYKVCTAWTLTAAEYDALQLTAAEYDALQLTAFEFDYLAKYYMIEKPGIISECEAYTDTAVENLADTVYNLRDDFEECCSEVTQRLDDDEVMFSPFKGVTESIKQVIFELAEVARAEAVTALYYDGLEMTATDYDGRQISAFNYDWHASAYLI